MLTWDAGFYDPVEPIYSLQTMTTNEAAAAHFGIGHCDCVQIPHAHIHGFTDYPLLPLILAETAGDKGSVQLCRHVYSAYEQPFCAEATEEGTERSHRALTLVQQCRLCESS